MMPNILTIDEIQERIQPIAEKYKLKKVSLFGSYARGEATPDSDVDLYIIDSPDSYKGIPWGAFAIYTDLEDALNKKVDIIYPQQIKQYWYMLGTKLLFKNIKSNEVILYERRAIQGHQHTGAYQKVL